jgi:hypothetical protein
MFLGLPEPALDPDPSIITQKNLDSYCYDLCNFNFGNPLLEIPDPHLFPIESNILTSFKKFQTRFFSMNENFLQAKLVDNPMFLRENPGQAVAAAGFLDRNFFGRAFYDTNKERLQNLKMNSLISEGNVVRYQQLLNSSGVPFTQVIYLRLLTAGNFATEKYAGKP